MTIKTMLLLLLAIRCLLLNFTISSVAASVLIYTLQNITIIIIIDIVSSCADEQNQVRTFTLSVAFRQVEPHVRVLLFFYEIIPSFNKIKKLTNL